MTAPCYRTPTESSRPKTAPPFLFSLDGRTVLVDSPSGRQGRQLLRALFGAEDERYRWLNNTLCVLAGKINPQTLRMEGRIYSCVSELV